MDKDKKIKIIVWILFIVIWAGLNYYIGARIWQIFGHFIPDYQYGYWGGLAFLAVSYIIGRLQNVFYWGKVSKGLYWIGSYWLAAFFIFS